MIRARIHRFLHCLFGMLSGHCAVTFRRGPFVYMACTCGKVFHESKS